MHFIYSVVTSVVHALHRTCPKCKRRQVVPRSKAHQEVPCKHCGAKMPPKVHR